MKAIDNQNDKSRKEKNEVSQKKGKGLKLGGSAAESWTENANGWEKGGI